MATPANSEDALDDVVDGLVDAAAVEEVAVEAYQRRKPPSTTRPWRDSARAC